MGIVNVTPDSFSDGGRYLVAEAAIAHGQLLWTQGADWLDVGGESTRPGAEPVPVVEEIARVVPVVAGLRQRLPDAVVSVDTSKAEVARAALEAGATVVNDVSAAADPAMGPLVARHRARLVLMHMRGSPRTMQADTAYDDLLDEVVTFLAAAAERVQADGVPAEHILVDPGVGFAKATRDNPRLIDGLGALTALGYPVLVGASRKRFIGALCGVDDPADRVHGSVGAALAASLRGASVLRVHDVAATIQALRVFRACLDA